MFLQKIKMLHKIKMRYHLIFSWISELVLHIFQQLFVHLFAYQQNYITVSKLHYFLPILGLCVRQWNVLWFHCDFRSFSCKKDIQNVLVAYDSFCKVHSAVPAVSLFHPTKYWSYFCHWFQIWIFYFFCFLFFFFWYFMIYSCLHVIHSYFRFMSQS